MRWLLLKAEIALIWPMRNINRPRSITLHDPNWDYIRLSNLELVAHEIYRRNIQGSIAELGVFKGDFASKINQAFPDRKLYLFDTFQGFDLRDVEVETEKDIATPDKTFPGADIKKMMDRMEHPDNIELRIGYFPETTKGMPEEIFAFVSLDVDLYQPTIEGLRYFYERLTPGGYIFVHDYHSRFFPGCGEAVREFVDSTGAPYLPVTDTGGSVVICKPM